MTGWNNATPMPMGFMATWGLVWIAGFIAAAIFVYNDAQRRGMNGWLWVLALLFTNVLGGLFIYLAVRDRLPVQAGGAGGSGNRRDEAPARGDHEQRL